MFSNFGNIYLKLLEQREYANDSISLNEQRFE